MPTNPNPDDKTKELFELLGLSDADVRQEFIRMASVSTSVSSDLQAHLRLDSMTSTSESGSQSEADAELA